MRRFSRAKSITRKEICFITHFLVRSFTSAGSADPHRGIPDQAFADRSPIYIDGMHVALTKFEKCAVFTAYLTVSGVLVGAAYYATRSNEPIPTAQPTSAAATVAVETPVELPKTVVIVPAPATQPTSPATLVPVPTTAVLPPVPSSPIDWPTADFTSPTTRPTTQPAAVVTIASPTTKPVDVVPVTQVVVHVAPAAPIIKPYAIDLPASRVTHLYISEIGTQPTWCELKLDPSQVSALANAITTIAERDHREADEFDHLATAAPKPEIALPWWRPAELIDPDLVVVSASTGTPWWIAMSRRTGRVFLYADKPVEFIAAR